MEDPHREIHCVEEKERETKEISSSIDHGGFEKRDGGSTTTDAESFIAVSSRRERETRRDKDGFTAE